MDELDRILEAEETIEPSSGLAASIMRAVREEAATPAPIQFPWVRLAFGMGTALLVIVVVAVAALFDLIPATTEPWDVSALLDRRTANSLVWTGLALAVSYGCYVLSLRLAGPSY